MLQIPCPWCGPRDETEFHCGGQAHVPYPAAPGELNDHEWGEYVFYRDNPKGTRAERWMHSGGCRRWFNVLRDTVSYQVLAAYRTDEPRPAINPSREEAGAPR